MSTRSAIARPTDTGFAGVYHHWDGYPEGLGRTLFQLYNGHFGRDLDAMLKVLIDEHPAGWSTINGKDMTLEPGFSDTFGIDGTCGECGEREKAHLCQTTGMNAHLKGGKYPCGADYGLHLGHRYEPDEATIRKVAALDRIPQCYCHGERSEEGHAVTEANASGSGCEWVYVLKDTPDGAFMLILSSYTSIGSPAGEKDQKMIGFFGMGDKDAEWKPVAIVGLDREQEPDWDRISESEPMSEGVA